MEPAPHNRRPSPTRLSCVCFSRIVSQSAPAKCCPNPNPAAPQAPGGRLARGARGGGAALSVLGCRPPVSGHRGVAREGSWDGSEGFLRGVGGIAACFFIAVCRHCPCQLPRATSRRPSLPRFSATIPNESNELQRLCTWNDFFTQSFVQNSPFDLLGKHMAHFVWQVSWRSLVFPEVEIYASGE